MQLAELHKIYASNKYSPNLFFLNPFTEIIFNSNWVWPEEYISQKKHYIKKPSSNSDNLKDKIKEWFQNLDPQSQRNFLTIKDKKFISTLCHFLPSYNSDNIYNMKSRKSIKNFEVSEKNSFVEKGLLLILQNFQVGFLREPVLHLSKNSEKFVCNELIKWMEIISHQKLFQFANKIKQSELPEQNILWFSENTFHKIQSFIVNQFEKSIIKNYFNRDRVQSNYLMDLKEFCKIEKDSLKNKNIENDLLSYSLYKTIELSQRQIQAKFNEMKEIQEKYEREKEKLIQKLLEDQSQNHKEQAKKKRRRFRKKKLEGQQNQKDENSSKKYVQKQNTTKLKITEKAANIKKFKAELNQTVQEQEKITQLGFNDEISHISKCEDSQFHETDVTFQKYFENEEKKIIPSNLQPEPLEKSFQSFTEEKQKTKNQSQTTFTEEPINKQINDKVNGEMTENSGEQNTGKSGQNKKKKSKKQKLKQNLHSNLIKSIRNSAFTEFIDSISIESNNLYNYKLSAYQFIVFFVSYLLPTTNITLFGSNAVGLSLASSDIDIMISNSRWSNISEVREVLYQIGNEISKMGWVIDYRLILNAKVPVLKLFIDPKNDYFQISPMKYVSGRNLMQSVVIKADIIVNIEGDQNIGCQSTLLMKQWLTDHPQLQRIILFFKYVLWYYGLNENYRGGICSYCLFLMVVSCLFKKVDGLRTGQKNMTQILEDQDQGTYIIEVLKYYSEVFDPKDDQISIAKGLKSTSTIEIKERKDEAILSKRNLAVKVIDPINGEYIESSFAKFQEVQQLFSMILVESMKLDDGLKRYLNLHEEINEEFSKLYQSLSQNSPGMNLITKTMEQVNQTKTKRILKKITSKLKKNEEVKYKVKEIVSIGFKIGIENWMRSSLNMEDRLNI